MGHEVFLLWTDRQRALVDPGSATTPDDHGKRDADDQSRAVHVCWLTGYVTVMPSAPTTAILLADGHTTIVCADLDVGCVLLHTTVDDVRAQSWQSGEGVGAKLRDALIELLPGASRVGVELSRVDAYASGGMDAPLFFDLRRSLPRATWVDVPLLVTEQRQVKSDRELDAMRVAGRMTQAGLDAALDAIRDGASESEVIAACYQTTIAAGSEVMSIDPMIVSGARAGYMPFIPHRDRRLAIGDSVYLESSASFLRYSAPLMRSASVGPPTSPAARLSAAAEETVDLLLQNLRGGRTGDDVARASKRALAELPEGTFFAGTFGYACGLGLQPTWTESPFYVAEGSEDVLLPGMTLHLPICVWSPEHRAGVGVSETVLITQTGCELITPGGDRSLRVC